MDSFPQMVDPTFKELFDSAVDKAMLLLGESGKQATYYYIEKTFGIERGMWHKHPELFAEAVEAIFGPGAQLLLRAIVKELYSSLGLKYKEPKGFQFEKLLRKAERYASRGGGSLIEKRGKGTGKRKRGKRDFRDNSCGGFRRRK